MTDEKKEPAPEEKTSKPTRKRKAPVEEASTAEAPVPVQRWPQVRLCRRAHTMCCPSCRMGRI